MATSERPERAGPASGGATGERVEKARRRIDAAAGDVERLIERQGERHREAAEKAKADLAAVRSENQRLRNLNEIVSKRLDATVKRLCGLLDA